MRLVFIAHSLPYPPEKDGHIMILYNLLTELSQRHHITLFCFGDKRDLPNIKRFTDLGIKVKLFDRPKRVLPLYYLSPKSRRLAWFQYQLYTPEMIWEIDTLDGRPDVDLIYFHSRYVSAYLAHVKKTPVVFGLIDALCAWYDQFRAVTGNPLKKIHYRLESAKAAVFEKRVLPTLAATVVVSEIDRANIKAQTSTANIAVIQNGVDLDFFRPSDTQPDPNTIVFTGAMDYPPNVQAVLNFSKHVWPKLKSANPELHWLIVGKNPTLDIFELQSLDKQITVTGYVKDIRTYLWRAALYVCPLTLGTGFNNKIIEAMACGKAVVASPESVPSLPISDGNNILIARSTDDFVAKISSLIASPDQRRLLEREARRFVEKYDWKETAKKYESVFEHAINEQTSSK